MRTTRKNFYRSKNDRKIIQIGAKPVSVEGSLKGRVVDRKILSIKFATKPRQRVIVCGYQGVIRKW